MISNDEANEKTKDLCSTITPARIMAIIDAFKQDEEVNQQEGSVENGTKEEEELGTQDEALGIREKVQQILEKHTIVRQKDWDVREHEQAVRKKKVTRILKNGGFAVIGGLWLIVPMLIMTLHPSKLTSLLTTSLFVIAAGLALGWFMDGAEPKDIVSTTAAYAAVLVVFVGVGNSST